MADKKTESNGKKRNDKGQFMLGNSGGPGRDKGSHNRGGINDLVDLILELATQEKNKEKISDALQRKIDDNPLHFWRYYLMPLFPKKIDFKDSTDFNEEASNAAKKMAEEQLEKV